jgi:hypothetical protein
MIVWAAVIAGLWALAATVTICACRAGARHDEDRAREVEQEHAARRRIYGEDRNA